MIMKFVRKFFFPGALGLILIIGIVYAFLPRPVPVDLALAARGPLRVTVEEDGKTRIKERYVIASPVTGQQLRIELHPGDKVEAGKTVLAVLEPSDPSLLDARALAEAKARVRAAEAAKEQAQAKLEAARAKHELTKHELGRAQKLRAGQSISAQEFDTVEHAEQTAHKELRASQFFVKVATFELDLAQAALIRTRPPAAGKEADNSRIEIHAPASGKILRVFQESAAVVTPGTKILEIGDPADLEAEIDVLSQDAVKIKPGNKVLFEHWGGGQPLLGQVRYVEPAAFLKISALGVEEQRVYVIADFVDPPEKRQALGDAFRVEARIIIWEGTDVLKIPAGALFRQGENWAVFAVVDGRATLRLVRAGHTNGLETQILEGLRENDWVIVHPSDRVQDGIRVVTR
jgi:HlyD family secretion protein